MATANPQTTINNPSTSTSSTTTHPSKPTIPSLLTTTTSPLLPRPSSLSTTPFTSASCYLCDEQNPGDFHPTTTNLSACLLCSRYFCRIHAAPPPSTDPNIVVSETVCAINHASYFREMLGVAQKALSEEAQNTGNERRVEARSVAEVLIHEGIFPSMGEREKAIFATSPVDEQTVRELGAWRRLESQVVNGGRRGEKGEVVERRVEGGDIAV